MIAALASRPPGLWALLRLGITLCLLAMLWRAVGGQAVLDALAAASPVWLGASILALWGQTVLSALRWRVTAAQLGQDIPAARALREYVLSQAVNQAVPGAIVGDAARAYRAKEQAGLLVAGQAVFFERLAGQIAMFLVMSVAFLATFFVGGGLDWPHGLAAVLWTAIGVAATCVAGSLILPRVRGMPPWASSAWLRPLRRALFARKVLPAQLALGAAIAACNLSAFAFAARAVGADLSVVEVAALVPVLLFAMLVPLTISGWGLREGLAALVLPIVGLSATQSVAASAMFGIALLISVIPGAFLVMAR